MEEHKTGTKVDDLPRQLVFLLQRQMIVYFLYLVFRVVIDVEHRGFFPCTNFLDKR